MFVIVPVLLVGSCVCFFCAWNTYNAAQIYNTQSENYLRMANERLYEADKLWRQVGKYNYTAKQAPKEQVAAKVLQFTRHLKSVPMEDDNSPGAA